MMKIFDKAKKELMQVSSLQREGDNLVLKGKIFGTMPMTAVLTPEQARAAFRMLDLKTILFLVTILFRKGAPADARK